MIAPCRGLSCRVHAAVLALGALAAPGLAQPADDVPHPRLDLTLNTVVATEGGGCRVTFVIRNDLGAAIEKLVTEAVLFDTKGRVATMTLFDFGALPEGRPRVRQFDLAGSSCDDIGEVLVNGIGTCEGDGLSPEICLAGLRLSSDSAVEVTG
ncbi:hypothetical protein ACROSR_05660 [Roseovarius tibetensis]|uniref:hypothetical protein n=1 Tax=Roseovarius tibetensis TaxID=2685897 RepID=UPI003D7F3871